MSTLVIFGLAAAGMVVACLCSVATALGFAVTRRRYSGATTTPFELACVAVFWPVAVVYIVGLLVAMADNRIEKRDAEKFDPDQALAKALAHDELRQLAKGRGGYTDREAER